jgi:hypothetical protein
MVKRANIQVSDDLQPHIPVSRQIKLVFDIWVSHSIKIRVSCDVTYIGINSSTELAASIFRAETFPEDRSNRSL